MTRNTWRAWRDRIPSCRLHHIHCRTSEWCCLDFFFLPRLSFPAAWIPKLNRRLGRAARYLYEPGDPDFSNLVWSIMVLFLQSFPRQGFLVISGVSAWPLSHSEKRWAYGDAEEFGENAFLARTWYKSDGPRKGRCSSSLVFSARICGAEKVLGAIAAS